MVERNALGETFRHVTLVLAREKVHPGGSAEEGYDLLVPLDAENQLDPVEWKSHQASCRVRKFKDGKTERVGLLRRKPGGTWYFDYEEGESDDEVGFKLNLERFIIGEYVSISSNGVMHTYQVARVEKP